MVANWFCKCAECATKEVRIELVTFGGTIGGNDVIPDGWSSG